MPIRLASLRIAALSVLAGAAVISCEDAFAPGVGLPATLRHAGGNAQRDTVGALLSEPLAVRVVDGAGNPIPGVRVTWDDGPFTGELDPISSITDTSGIARTRWQLARTTGGQRATATVDGLPPLEFVATALAVVRPGPLGWALVHRGLPEPDGPVIGIAGSNPSDVFVAIETGRVFWYDGFGWSELISNPPAGPLGKMWGPASTAIFATGRTAAGDSGFVASFHQSWVVRYVRAGATFHALHGRSADELWAVGSEIAHYDGDAWHRIAAPGTTLRAVWASGPGVAFVGGDDGSLHRVDTATTQTGNPLGVGIRALFGFAPDDVYAGDANGTVLRWDGSQWSIAAQLGPEPIVAIGGSGPDDLWVAGGVYAHFDGGAWRIFDDDEALARGTAGIFAAARTATWATTDSMRLKLYDGTEWREHWDSPVAFEGIWGTSAGDLHVCGGQGTVQRFDGNQWHTTRLGGWQACRSVDGTSGSLVLASTAGPNAYRFDGGAWERAPTGAALAGGIWVDVAGIAMAPGPPGMVMRYDGAAWAPLTTGSAAPLYTVWGSAPDDVWAGGANGTLLHYDGAAWSPAASPATGAIRRLWGLSASVVFAVADDASSGSVILRYDGAQWRVVHASAERLLAIHGRNANDVFAAGDGGTVLRWDGSAWQAEPTGVSDALIDLWASPDGDVFTVGARGVILRGRR